MEYFSHDEIACPCCKVEKLRPAFKHWLDYLRETLGMPVDPSSVYRCDSYNKVCGGHEASYHPKGMAIDIKWSSAAYLYKLVGTAIDIGASGIEICDKHVHFDLRPGTPKLWWGKSV